MTAKRRILIVDDDPSIRSLFSRFVQDSGYDFRTAASLAAMWKMFRSHSFDAVLLDMNLPDGSSLDCVAQIREQFPHLTIVMITANAELPLAVEAIQRGADNFLEKPVNLPSLSAYLKSGFEAGALRRHKVVRDRKKPPFVPFRGSSSDMRHAWELAGIAARNSAAVLILGETGTGKGVFARWIHENSDRAERPFVSVNCSGLRGEMLASELFGHVKGAFTSAVSDKTGLIELASEGTLFLDEIGDMDPELQARFLKVIEEKHYRRLGEAEERFSDFRLICATHQDLQMRCRENLFREDLLFRINVFPLTVPPVRKCRSDIPSLADYLIKSLAPGREDVITDEALNLLKKYGWPGNIREMRNLLERALLLAQGGPIEARHLPGLTENGTERSGSELNLDHLEQDRIKAAMKQAGGSAGEAARLLGLSRATLYRKLKKMQK